MGALVYGLFTLVRLAPPFPNERIPMSNEALQKQFVRPIHLALQVGKLRAALPHCNDTQRQVIITSLRRSAFILSQYTPTERFNGLVLREIFDPSLTWNQYAAGRTPDWKPIDSFDHLNFLRVNNLIGKRVTDLAVWGKS